MGDINLPASGKIYAKTSGITIGDFRTMELGFACFRDPNVLGGGAGMQAVANKIRFHYDIFSHSIFRSWVSKGKLRKYFNLKCHKKQ